MNSNNDCALGRCKRDSSCRDVEGATVADGVGMHVYVASAHTVVAGQSTRYIIACVYSLEHSHAVRTGMFCTTVRSEDVCTCKLA
jgi:hypothetical protein